MVEGKEPCEYDCPFPLLMINPAQTSPLVKPHKRPLSPFQEDRQQLPQVLRRPHNTRGRVRNTADREGWGSKLHQLRPGIGMGRDTAWLQRSNWIRLVLHLGRDSRHRFRLPDALDGCGLLVGYKGLQHKQDGGLGHGLGGHLRAGGLARLGPCVLRQLLLFGRGTVCGDIEDLGQLVHLDGAIKFHQLTHEVEVWGDGRPLVLDKLVGLLHG